MYYYKLRVDLKVPKEQIVTLVSDASNSYCYVVEQLETNPHIHFYLETLVLQPALRARIRKLVGSGNGTYSLKNTEEHPIEYLAYLLKEGTPIYFNIPEGVRTLSVEYDAKVKAERKALKASRETRLQKLKTFIAKGLEEAKANWNLPNVTRLTLLYYKEEQLLVREFAIVSQIQTILLQEDDEYFRVLSNRIRDKLE